MYSSAPEHEIHRQYYHLLSATMRLFAVANRWSTRYHWYMKRYLNASDVARILKVNRATITRWIQKGVIQGEQQPTGRKEWVIAIREFEQFAKTYHESRDV